MKRFFTWVLVFVALVAVETAAVYTIGQHSGSEYWNQIAEGNKAPTAGFLNPIPAEARQTIEAALQQEPIPNVLGVVRSHNVYMGLGVPSIAALAAANLDWWGIALLIMAAGLLAEISTKKRGEPSPACGAHSEIPTAPIEPTRPEPIRPRGCDVDLDLDLEGAEGAIN